MSICSCCGMTFTYLPFCVTEGFPFCASLGANLLDSKSSVVTVIAALVEE